LIQEINRLRLATVRDLSRALAHLRRGDSAALLVRRGSNTFFAAVQIP
jgi:enoyl-CoA hydratase/carnithine racemase